MEIPVTVKEKYNSSFDLAVAAGFLMLTFHPLALLVDSPHFVAFDGHLLLRAVRHLPSGRGRSSLRGARRTGIPQPSTIADIQRTSAKSRRLPMGDMLSRDATLDLTAQIVRHASTRKN